MTGITVLVALGGLLLFALGFIVGFVIAFLSLYWISRSTTELERAMDKATTASAAAHAVPRRWRES